MPRQLSCHSMCKIVSWSGNYSKCKNTEFSQHFSYDPIYCLWNGSMMTQHNQLQDFCCYGFIFICLFFRIYFFEFVPWLSGKYVLCSLVMWCSASCLLVILVSGRESGSRMHDPCALLCSREKNSAHVVLSQLPAVFLHHPAGKQEAVAVSLKLTKISSTARDNRNLPKITEIN